MHIVIISLFNSSNNNKMHLNNNNKKDSIILKIIIIINNNNSFKNSWINFQHLIHFLNQIKVLISKMNLIKIQKVRPQLNNNSFNI